MSKSFIHQHIKNIKKQRDSSVLSVPVKITTVIPIIVNQDNITFSNLTVVIKEISRIKKAQQTALKEEVDKLNKEKEAAEQERIRKAEKHQKQEETRLFCEAEERRLLELERERVEQARRLEEEKTIKEQLAAQKLEEQRLAMLEQQRLFRETQERLAREEQEQKIATEAEKRLEIEKQMLEQQRIAREIEERSRLEQEKLIQEQQAAQLLQPVQILAPKIPVELPVLEPLHSEKAQFHVVLPIQQIEINQNVQEHSETVITIEPEPIDFLNQILELEPTEPELIEFLSIPLEETSKLTLFNVSLDSVVNSESNCSSEINEEYVMVGLIGEH